ncbi:MBL fold metallo-hydrolase [Homoserinibacter sp. YIM 151385]|uniref:MBL fold metallo-hydrolase n=1 Tax=Homoserinibacter sp. YIM 151385 TaxID=2985506 RepID=UPI0022F13BA7|nr:MBL fold metallo-hydrolase [Homoserinibacter sp. YIM 151385]WBU37972.1 MBL fold metallo-hydrolase [Homoserinibacter sp. YIM 151385]
MSTTAVTLVGGPTVLLEWAGLRIVTDPTFDAPQEYAESGSTTLVKTAGPAISRGELGPVDLVLLSHHGHKDNLDWEGLELLATGVSTLSTREAASDLWGGSVVGLDDWESQALGSITITVVPALHGPSGSERFVGPVVGFVLEAPDAPTVYVSGDNASLPLVGQIAERFGPIDVAVLFGGGARVPRIDGTLTLTAEEAVRAAEVLRASRAAVVHTDGWAHFTESREDVERAFAGSAVYVATPLGERVVLDER